MAKENYKLCAGDFIPFIGASDFSQRNQYWCDDCNETHLQDSAKNGNRALMVYNTLISSGILLGSLYAACKGIEALASQ